jgi:hypothetical protein
VQLLQQNLDRFQRSNLSPSAKNFSEVIDPDYSLKSGYVLGENTIRGVYVRNAEIVRMLAIRLGLRLEKSSSRPLPSNRRYLPPPTSGMQTMDARMSYEIILQLRKASARAKGIQSA